MKKTRCNKTIQQCVIFFLLFVNISLGYKLQFCNAPAVYQQTTIIIGLLTERGESYGYAKGTGIQQIGTGSSV